MSKRTKKTSRGEKRNPLLSVITPMFNESENVEPLYEKLSSTLDEAGLERVGIVASGDLDVNMALWRPSQSGILDPRLAAGELVEVVKNIDGARFQLCQGHRPCPRQNP